MELRKMTRHNKTLTLTVLLSLLALATVCSNAYASYTWESDTVFEYADGSRLSLKSGVVASFENKTQTDTAITFTALAVNGGTASTVIVTPSSTNVTIQEFDLTRQVICTVQGTGTVTFTMPKPYSVYINDLPIAEGYGWTYTAGNNLVITGATSDFVLNYNSGSGAGSITRVSLALYGSMALAGAIPLVIMAIVILMIVKTQGNIDHKELILMLVAAIIASILAMEGVLIWSTASGNLESQIT